MMELFIGLLYTLNPSNGYAISLIRLLATTTAIWRNYTDEMKGSCLSMRPVCKCAPRSLGPFLFIPPRSLCQIVKNVGCLSQLVIMSLEQKNQEIKNESVQNISPFWDLLMLIPHKEEKQSWSDDSDPSPNSFMASTSRYLSGKSRWEVDDFN